MFGRGVVPAAGPSATNKQKNRGGGKDGEVHRSGLQIILI